MAKPLNWIAAPILAQRNIELSQVFTHYDETAMATVYTLHTAEGKIGSFSVPTMTLLRAVNTNAVEDLLAPMFEGMEFFDDKPAVPEIEPAQQATEADSAEPGPAETTVNADGASSPAADPEGSTEATEQPEGQEQGSGQAAESAGEHGTDEPDSDKQSGTESGGIVPETAIQ